MKSTRDTTSAGSGIPHKRLGARPGWTPRWSSPNPTERPWTRRTCPGIRPAGGPVGSTADPPARPEASSASIGLASGETLLEVSRRLCPSSISVTANVYSTVSPEVARESAKRLSRHFQPVAPACTASNPLITRLVTAVVPGFVMPIPKQRRNTASRLSRNASERQRNKHASRY
jgi:hypothetical protein